MINYEPESSPFFEANKKYCQSIEAKLQEYDAECTGFCNSFGYEIKSRFKKGKFDCTIEFTKHQSTRNELIPTNADDYAGVEFRMTGFKPDDKIEFGKNKLKRLLLSEELKKWLPSPCYFSSNRMHEPVLNEKLIQVLLKFEVDSFLLNKGGLKVTLHSPSIEWFLLMEELEHLFL